MGGRMRDERREIRTWCDRERWMKIEVIEARRWGWGGGAGWGWREKTANESEAREGRGDWRWRGGQMGYKKRRKSWRQCSLNLWFLHRSQWSAWLAAPWLLLYNFSFCSAVASCWSTLEDNKNTRQSGRPRESYLIQKEQVILKHL